ncbi:SlyX family protein [Neptunicella sp. SCSIO 80796]|uniref:SlyX family protein n=1 Tax=Neptunicella plasticusilytica TaxID=3117012 RepID=UPI003A4DD83C
MNDLTNQIEQLQTKVAFQDDTIEQLNDALTNQQSQLEKLQFQMQYLLDKVKNMQSSNIAREDQEAPPPHY